MGVFGHTKDVGNMVAGWAQPPATVQMTWLSAIANGESSTMEEYFGNNGTVVPNHLVQTTVLNCYDIFLLALFEGGWADRQTVWKIMGDAFTKGVTGLIASGIGAGITNYSGTSPNLGHLVFFDTMGHVAMSTGRQATHFQTTGSEVVSFWTDATGIAPDNNGPIAGTPVCLDTIERIVTLSPTFQNNVISSKPRWR